MYGENKYHQRFFFFVRSKNKKKTKIIVLNIVLYIHA